MKKREGKDEREKGLLEPCERRRERVNGKVCEGEDGKGKMREEGKG